VEFKSSPPSFFDAKLSEGTIWRGAKWPLPEWPNQAGEFIDAYERLKLEMDRLKKHQDELDFFAIELKCRQFSHGTWTRSGLPIALYGLLCDYGRSYVRPLLGIAITAVILAPLFCLHLGWSKLRKAFGLSFANTFGVLGFRKDFIDTQLIEHLPGPLKILGAGQTMAGIVLLFLLAWRSATVSGSSDGADRASAVATYHASSQAITNTSSIMRKAEFGAAVSLSVGGVQRIFIATK
jgi:hypothetical protein